MESSWKLIRTHTDTRHLALLYNLLEANGIPAQLLDKSDSSFPFTGVSELYVPAEQSAAAEMLIRTHGVGENEQEH